MEGLVAGFRGVGVDGGEVDLVGPMGEVGDHVAGREADPAVGDRVEVEGVVAAAVV